MTTKIRIGVLSLVGSLALSALADAPTISDVVVRQRWPWSRLVDIEYVLQSDAPQTVDVAISAHNGFEMLSFPLDALSGDLYNVRQGIRRIVLDPTKTAYTNEALTRFSVELTPVTVHPLYMIVNLKVAAGATNQIEYVYEEDLVTNKFGPCQSDFVTNAGTVVESIIWTGVNDDEYKTDKLVLRRIPAGSFDMGDSTNIAVTLTKDYYIGVFEVTAAQWLNIMGDATVSSTKPILRISYNTIRGATDDVPSVDWPTTGSYVSPTNFLGVLRDKTGIPDFDFPTEAQWEYACRAGTTTVYNDGNTNAVYTTTGSEEWDNNGVTNRYLDVLGWYQFNEKSLHVGGLRLPNAWGLYDMHGNAFEWVLDWGSALATGELTDPPGEATGSGRMRRGGGWDRVADNCRSAYRVNVESTSAGGSQGFRIVRALP